MARLDESVTPKPIQVLIICAAGMSSSLLIDAIEKAGSEAEYSLNVITYHSFGSAYWDFEKDTVDVVLVAPQIRFLRKGIEKLAAPFGIPVVVIEPMSYGMADGESLLQQVMTAIKSRSTTNMTEGHRLD